MEKRIAVLLAGAFAAAVLMGGCQRSEVAHGGLPPETTPAPTPTASPTLPPEETSSQPGHWDGDIYTFDILDLQYVLPDGWFYLTPEQIAASQHGSGGQHDGTDVLLALDPNGGSTIQILWEPLPLFAQGEADPEAVLLQMLAGGTDYDLECSFGEPFSTRFGALDFMTIQIDIVHQGIAMRQFYSVHVEGEGEGAMVLSIQLTAGPDAVFEELPGGVSAFRSSGIDLRGIVGEWDESGRVYTHPLLGLQYTLPDGWYCETEQDLQAGMQNFFASEVTGQQAKDWMQQNLYLDMMRADGSGKEMVDITAQYLGDIPVDAEQYARNTIRQTEVSDSLIEFSVGEIRSIRLGNTEFVMLPLSTGYRGDWMLQWLCMRREGEWMYIISIGAEDEARAAELAQSFSSLPAG